MSFLLFLIFVLIAISLCQSELNTRKGKHNFDFNDTYCPQCRTRVNKDKTKTFLDIRKKFTEYFSGDEDCGKTEERELKFEICPDYDYSDYIFNATWSSSCMCAERDQRMIITLDDQSNLFCCAPNCPKIESRGFFIPILQGFIVWGISFILERFVFDIKQDTCCYETSTSAVTTLKTTKSTIESTTLPSIDPCEEF
ncbi:unnamed protein product [Chironomus riparius]|uniref:Uncharacterized protein n=1 Tax=Chironomus riparius TaxID=315576 RepID=A0A9N9S0F8_9DIPT|nr:unnamed protein product [Chironomus riparius]